MNKVKYTKEQLQEYLSELQETSYYFNYLIIGFACFVSVVFFSGFSELNNIFENGILLFLFVVSILLFILVAIFKNLLEKNLDINIGIISLCYAFVFEIYFSSNFTDSWFKSFILLNFFQMVKVVLFLLVKCIMIWSIQKNKKSSIVSCSIATICGFFIAKSMEEVASIDTEFVMFSLISILIFNLMYLFIVKGKLKRQSGDG